MPWGGGHGERAETTGVKAWAVGTAATCACGPGYGGDAVG
jgi:hypothetical protein